MDELLRKGVSERVAAGFHPIWAGTMGLAGITRFGFPPLGYGLPY
jgi:hypothetical protein